MTRDPGIPQHIAQRKEMERANLAHNLAQRLLSSVNRSAMGDQTLAWLKNVNENVPNMPAQQSDGPSGSLTTISIMDKLFDDFERYSFHFNQAEPDRRYVISCIRPAQDRSPDVGERYLGSLNNSLWTIIMIGHPESITATFMEARYAYEKESHRPPSNPILEMTASTRHGQILWKVKDKTVFYHDLAYLSKMIFARLNRVSRGEVVAAEPLFPEMQQANAPSNSSFSFGEELIPGDEPGGGIDMIGNSLIVLLESIDGELQELDRAGLMALKTKGVQGVIKFGKRAEELKLFRIKVAELATQWANALSARD